MSDTSKLQLRHLGKKLAQNRTLAIVACGFLALAIGALFSTVRVPVPKVHDEFSYLLAADTFSAGRWTNPTHPMWQHFESFHVIQKPSYASKYQPGQGLILALGTLIGGQPIVGAWLATALAAAAVCWMLQGWVPSRWALLGGLLVALHATLQVRWSLSYWGGSLPMAGGALMFGALPRILRQPRATTSMVLAMGAILLATTRPFEGFLVGICVATALVMWMFSKRCPGWGVATTRVLLPSAVVLGLGIASLGYYNWQVTGDPMRMPYQVHEQQYGFSPLFLWKSPKLEPDYRHDVIRDFQTGWAIEDYQRQQSLGGWLQVKVNSFKNVSWFFLGGSLCVPLLMLPRLLAQQNLRFVWIAMAVFLLAEMTVPWIYPHYFAPIAPLLFLFVVEGLRYIAVLPRWGHAWAKFAVPAIVGLHFLALPTLFAQYANWQPTGWQWQRARLEKQLENSPEKHLVLVHYGPDHVAHDEWVYNRADIDGAKVVWARPMGPSKDAKLIKYFRDRTVWHLDADAEQPKLVEFPTKPRGDTHTASTLRSVP